MNQRGTTMVEIMISVIVVGVFAATFFQAVTRPAMSTKASTDKQIIMDSLRDEIDQSLAEAHDGVLTATSRTVTRTPAVDFAVAITKTVTAVPLSNNLYNVKVTATWGPSSGQRTTMSLATIAFKDPS